MGHSYINNPRLPDQVTFDPLAAGDIVFWLMRALYILICTCQYSVSNGATFSAAFRVIISDNTTSVIVFDVCGISPGYK